MNKGNRIYYKELGSPDGLLYSGNGVETGLEPYPLHEDQGDGRFKRYRIVPPQTESLDVLKQQILDVMAERERLSALHTRLWENLEYYRKNNNE